MEKVKVKENPNYVKDLNSGAILNTDRSSITKHEIKLLDLKKKKQVDNEINNLKTEVSEIKDLLSKILKVVSDEK